MKKKSASKSTCKNKLSKWIKIPLGILAGVLMILLAYIIYLYAAYHRIPDNQELDVTAPSEKTSSKPLTTGQIYSALTYNVGFGAYSPDFSFFMDGGKSSWAKSKENVTENISGAGSFAASKNPDFVLFQEVDFDSTRSHHVNEYDILKDTFPGYYSVFAQNYDSPFLFYPLTQPHGKNHSGITLFSRYPVTSSLRRSFPIATSFKKFFDLDRCYSISRIPVDNGKEFVIFELHMSAYGNDNQIRQGQIQMLCQDMEKEYEAGNYVLCGGDFNHDLKASEDDTSEHHSWAYPFPRKELPEHFNFGLDLLTSQEKDALWNTSRNTDIPYDPDASYTVTLDGFIISDNIQMDSYEDLNTGYSYSDHDPVYIQFSLI